MEVVPQAIQCFDVESVRETFPLLSNRSLVYFDNAASLQKPGIVIDAEANFYRKHYANVHRSDHRLAHEATEAYETTRVKVADFLGTKDKREIIFTSGTTDAINLVACGWGESNIQSGDEILVSRLEHHANFVPWQQLALRKGAKLVIAELDSNGRLSEEDFRAKLSLRTKLVALTGMSNVTGEIVEIEHYAKLARDWGAKVLIDMAQLIVHRNPNVLDLDKFDFLAFSSHKLGGPTGLGVLWARAEILEVMRPFRFGGEMISRVGDEDSDWNEIPYKFEAGTPHIAGVIGLAAALDFLGASDFEGLAQYEASLAAYALEALRRVEGIRILGPQDLNSRGPIFSFMIKGIHAHDLGTFLDSKRICVRGGQHCAQPLHRKMKWASSLRASLCFYNRFTEVDQFVEALHEARKFFDR
ncbi:MAG: cysteine desulfurase [Deltaproteobacteria bacterium CG11_big_fil_rev_8_21_14_0_20_45_16]|nr:MAG: cysteine desulfurase [Deltaproteobacteria bacterium CG11_big_fil_rev_8_21_14_0_20_45_16]